MKRWHDNAHEHPLPLTPIANKHCDIVGSLIKNSKSVPTWCLSNNGCDRHNSVVLQQCVTDKEVETSDGDWENADTCCSYTNQRCSVFFISGESVDEQGTAVRASAFVRLTIIMKSAPCVKSIMCKCHCSTDTVLRINGWTGFCKSLTPSFISAGIIVASPDCLSVQSAIISVPLCLEQSLCCEVHALFSFRVQMGKNSMTCCAGDLGD